MFDLIIRFSFYLLFLLTPLLWTKYNFELFEFNKMLLVYLLTTLITGSWLLKSLINKKLNLKRTSLDIPLLLFLLSNILSTYFSIDRHTSIWGYYSRSNGGLLSILSYILLYFALVSNLNKDQALKTLKFGLVGGFLVSLYAIPEHFGVSPSCLLLHQQWTAGCWVQDVQARVFATLGQPNWLAGYLGMLIFPAIYFFLNAKATFSRTFYLMLIIIYYLAFTFTYSQSGLLGLLGGLILFAFLALLGKTQRSEFKKPLLIIALTFILINLIFGSALGRFNLAKYINFSQNSTPIQSGSKVQTTNETPKPTSPPSGTTALETGGTDSGKIRLIVWQGALGVFSQFPIFGSGVETFAYSYYLSRPSAHNYVSEWDFLYNKAHNELLNYLATTGTVGSLAYLGIILIFSLSSLKLVLSNIKDRSSDRSHLLLTAALLSSVASYFISIFFGFSVVAMALLFYTLPAIGFVLTDQVKDFEIGEKSFLNSLLNSGKFNPILTVITTVLVVFCAWGVVTIWYADTLFAQGESYSDAGSPTKAFQFLDSATRLRSDEPFYHSEFGFAAAATALIAEEQDATLSAKLREVAANETAKALSISPKNVSYYKTASRTLFTLSTMDPKYEEPTLNALSKSIELSPNDPKAYYNKGLILGQLDKKEEAIKALEKAIELKSNYREAHLTLGDFYVDLGLSDKAKAEYEIVLQIIPGDVEATDKINNLK